MSMKQKLLLLNAVGQEYFQHNTLQRNNVLQNLKKILAVEADRNPWFVVSPPFENGTYTEVRFQ